jgi:hypothetical protein
MSGQEEELETITSGGEKKEEAEEVTDLSDR